MKKVLSFFFRRKVRPLELPLEIVITIASFVDRDNAIAFRHTSRIFREASSFFLIDYLCHKKKNLMHFFFSRDGDSLKIFATGRSKKKVSLLGIPKNVNDLMISNAYISKLDIGHLHIKRLYLVDVEYDTLQCEQCKDLTSFKLTITFKYANVGKFITENILTPRLERLDINNFITINDDVRRVFIRMKSLRYLKMFVYVNDTSFIRLPSSIKHVNIVVSFEISNRTAMFTIYIPITVEVTIVNKDYIDMGNDRIRISYY